ncbi:ATP-binding protein [Rhodoferax antarcticus]|uniref:histidine kinase n=1 Tax=Rhodoferax antarcticus ANT.BR TaxID=1111071 RepID=A0A1Q8YAD3_9BURK|nr:ATP-binding protein [Rhodoferax antarcticus]APW47125.1 two-component sensor histidine kinase [Rhodoferax antarcticus]OLP05021.1 Sensor protein QseC with HAMP domain [Rhodoferax antarcticus ANT.BR]
MSLQRRLLIYLLICAPLVWAAAAWVSSSRARAEVNELFDTEMIRLALQVQATLLGLDRTKGTPTSTAVSKEADLEDLAITVWDQQGKVLLADREGTQLPLLADAVGFVELSLQHQPWRVYYLQAPNREWLVAAGQKIDERDELVWGLVESQLLPWLLTLPVLLLAMAWAVRQALSPMRALTHELQQRTADDLQAIPSQQAPAEIQPLLQAMNGLFGRIDATLARERRFTADAAHELRTPLAVLSAQWEVLQSARTEPERVQAAGKLSAGMQRMTRLVDQLLRLSRLEATDGLTRAEPLDWRALAEQSMSDTLALAERRQIDLACEWPEQPHNPPDWQGDAHLLAVLLRNLLDNAVRYAPEGSTVTLRLTPSSVSVENAGAPLPAEQLGRMGERFYRPDGQAELGSGLGVSIAQRIAALHGLVLSYHPQADGAGVVAELTSVG